MFNSFTGGIHPQGNKKLTSAKAIEPAGIPETVYIPLAQHAGKPAVPVVKVKDEVKTGQLIANADGFISAPIHSSVTGVVEKIDTFPHPVSGKALAVQIKTSQTDEIVYKSEPDLSALELPKDQLLDKVRKAGIVGMGGAGFPTSVKLAPPPDKKVDALVINGTECEPYLTCDHRMMLEHSREIFLGIEIALKILGIDNAYVGIENNKKDAFEQMKKTVSEMDSAYKCSKATVKMTKTKYPQGAEKTLIKTLLKREVPSGGLPFDAGVIVMNVGTAFAIYEAVCLDKPVIERVITVTGKSVKNPANLKTRIGTTLSYLIEKCSGTTEETGKIVCGGPMMGFAQISDQVPATKGTSGVLVFSKREILAEKQSPCIRCGRCNMVCPMGRMPGDIARMVAKGKNEELEKMKVKDCIECGACAFACPAKIPLVDFMKLSKVKTPKK